ncbi:MAG: NAD(P)-dependent oxidoreductase [Jannaschia sp.]
MRILVTGGSGFLGLALTDALARRGDAVTSADLGPPPAELQAARAEGIEFRRLDVTDAAAIRTLLDDVRPETIVHAAAATPDAAREAAGDSAAIVAANIGGTANLIEAAAVRGTRILALSSVAIYGRTLADTNRLHENMPPRPQILYAITKAAAESLALRLGAVHDMPVCTPRIGILWGAWEHRTSLRATPSPAFAMFEAARAGHDIVLPEAASAPLLHVDACVAALLALIDGDVRGIINLGAPASVDLVKFAVRIAERYGVTARIDSEAANIPLFAANRPPTDNTRLHTATGHDIPAHDTALIAAHADWLDAHYGTPVSQSAI